MIRGVIIFILFNAPHILWGTDTWKLYDDSQIAIVEITISPWALNWMLQNVESDSLHPAKIRFQNAWIDETIDSVGVRIRGNTSRQSQKKSLKLSFNTFVPGRQFYGVDKLNLNGEHNDPSIIRSKLCWDFFKEIGLTASRAAHATVYINGNYFGLYISVEHIDDEFLQNHFADDTGNLWKCLYPADLTWRGAAPGNYFPYFDAKRPYELKTNRDEYDFSQLASLIDIINNTSDHNFAESLEQILVVPEVLKYLAMNVLLGSWDDYWFLNNNYYLYHEPAMGKFHWIPYDYDNTFGIDWFDVDWISVDPYVFVNFEANQGGSPGPRPLADRMMSNPQYRDLFSHFLTFYSENVYDLPIWESKLDSLKGLITPWAEADNLRTLDYGFTIDDFHNSFGSGAYSNQHVKKGIKEFVNGRNATLPAQIVWLNASPIVYDFHWSPKYPQPHDSIHVTASIFGSAGLTDVTIQFLPGHLTYFEMYPMDYSPVPQTKLVEEADRWLGTIPPLGTGGFGLFHIAVTDNLGQIQYYPQNAPVQVESINIGFRSIVINEFLARNDNVNTDEASEYDDWVELYNPGDEVMFLSGMYLTDDPDNLTKWQFPYGGVGIGPQEHLLIWCDGDLNQPGLHAGFRLSADGEFVGLVADDGVTIFDSLSFGPQTGDVSHGRNPDGADTWEYFIEPTPEAPNFQTHVDEGMSLPTVYRLLQNTPNPFNPTTTIRYALPEQSHVHIAIYDILGKEIKCLVDLIQTPGNKMVVWEGTDNLDRDVSAGIYLVTLNVGTFKQTRKALLIR